MSKKLLATTAVITLLSVPAFADGLNLNTGIDANIGADVTTESSENGLSVGADADVDAGADVSTDSDSDTSAQTDLDISTDVTTDTDAQLDTSTDVDAEVSADTENNDSSASVNIGADAMLAADFIGEDVRTSSDADAEIIGDINAVVLNDEGNADWIIVGVGGFLGLGEKEIAISAEQVTWADIDGDRFVVSGMTKAEIEASDAFDREMMESSGDYTAEDFSWTAEGEARLKASVSQ